MTTYVRNREGDIFHLASCTRAPSKPVPWHWAEPYDVDLSEAFRLGVRPCKVCLPGLWPYNVTGAVS